MSARHLLRAPTRWLKNTLRRVVRASPPSTLGADLWDLQLVTGEGLALHGVALHSLVRKWGSPLHVVDVNALRRNAQRYRENAAGRPRGCEVYYSYKTNPVPFVLKTLHEFGIGAEVISAYELWLALRLGVPPERIVYNGPAKSAESIGEAIDRDIGLLMANHGEEIAVFAAAAAARRKRPRVGIRVALQQGWSAQFGSPIAGGDALRAFAAALATPHLDVQALHAHRGGMIRTEGELSAFVGEVLQFTDVLAEHLKLELAILDFGGSLATPSVHGLGALDRRLNRTLLRDLPAPDAAAALGSERYLALLEEMVRDHYMRRSRPQPRIFIEPGRALTGNTQLLLATVHSLKQASDRVYAILDAGINVAESVRAEFHQILPVNRAGDAATQTYTVVGPICTPGDTLYPAVKLPPLQVGDTVAIMDAGAYFVPFSTSFSFPQPGIVALDNGSDFSVRRAERFEDLIARDEFID